MAEADVEDHFAAYLAARRGGPLLSPIVQAWVARSRPSPQDLAWLDGFAAKARGEWDAAAAAAERGENLPRLTDAGEVALCSETWAALAGVHGSGLWRTDLDERLRYAAVMALNQNGEGGVACSVACTDGLLRVLRAKGGHAATLDRLGSMSSTAWLHGAQFVTEIQGGSDAASNAVQARPAPEGTFTLHGQKWFCSNLTADLWLVTARPTGAPEGAKGLGLFLVESAGGGYAVERLKDKVGTRALPTAEIRFRGAVGSPVGPLDEGLRTMVAEVLVPSRIHNIVAVAGFLRRAQREADAYAATRSAFGRTLDHVPLLADVLGRLRAAADRAEAGACATVDAWLEGTKAGASEGHALLQRVLVSLHKAVATREAQAFLQEAMSVLGGNGIDERFSALPRLWRDSVILETWEGPYTLLLAQALADLRRGGVAGHEEGFLHLWHGGRTDEAEVVALREILASDHDDPKAAVAWRGLAHRLVADWQERALADLRP